VSAEASASGRADDIRVLIADDQKIVREGLVSLISLLPGITVIGAATDGDDAVRQALDLAPDVVLMDLNMPHCNGVEATERLRRLRPDASVGSLFPADGLAPAVSTERLSVSTERLRCRSQHAGRCPRALRSVMWRTSAPQRAPSEGGNRMATPIRGDSRLRLPRLTRARR
jgi:DNA-binding NarL/FixJ family response regulator